MTVHADTHGFVVQAARPAVMQTVAISAGSLQSTAFQTQAPGTYTSAGAPVLSPNNTTHVRVVGTSDCWIAFGANPTAAVGGSASMLLPAGVPEYFWVAPGERIAVIQNSGAGTLSIAELAQ